LYVNLVYGCREYEVAPFPHEEDPLVCEQAKTRQAREAKQSQSEEESAYKNKVSRALTSQELGHTQSILESANIVGHVMIEQSTKHCSAVETQCQVSQQKSESAHMLPQSTLSIGTSTTPGHDTYF
jgi:hypothetical protein